MSSLHRTRRQFVGALPVVAVAVPLGVAGCLSTDSSDDGRGEYSDAPFVETEPDYDGWFDTVDGFEGTLDLRDESSVRISVGAGGGLSFSPMAIRIGPSTEVVWEWTGRGGEHNVIEETAAFGSELVNEAGHRFRHVFDSNGVYRYICEPHAHLGMRGAIDVR